MCNSGSPFGCGHYVQVADAWMLSGKGGACRLFAREDSRCFQVGFMLTATIALCCHLPPLIHQWMIVVRSFARVALHNVVAVIVKAPAWAVADLEPTDRLPGQPS